MKEVKGR